MNGDEKEEAHRPRPLSAGIWTLFSWLRRSERSSSSESLSSVGSARTAVSFDFLAPGNCDFSKTPIVLTSSHNPPTETYKKRLQDRNLRRQRDRDVTLHRKYGLFREHGNVYDGFTLPVKWTENTDRPNRERRATSELYQRRAAYVPGKRRAPLPPAITTSASLPRTYKRKRPAPKPPVKNAFKGDLLVQSINNPTRMTTNSESEDKYIPENNLINDGKTQKCDKKVTSLRDTKSRTDKNFLKHIFESKKRGSLIETTTVRLLPSISELDKQASEIIEKNKLRHDRNDVDAINFNNLQNRNAVYEGNSWFCTTCLRKYNSSVDSCDHCLRDKRQSFKHDGLKISSSRAPISIQTDINVESASSSQSNMDERRILKEILKEMKDSLPKKNKDKLNNVITENPTLRIGSTVQETYKDLSSQPSSSSEVVNNKNRIFPTPKNIYIAEHLKSKDQGISHSKEQSSFAKNESMLLSVKTKKYTPPLITKIKEHQKLDSTNLKNPHDNLENPSHSQPHSSSKTNNCKDIKENSQVLITSSGDILGSPQYLFKGQNNVSSTTNILEKSSEASSTSLVNNVALLTSHSNINTSKGSKQTSVKNTETNSIKNISTVQNESTIINKQIKTSFQKNNDFIKNININPHSQTKANVEESLEKTVDNIKPDNTLHTPLNISSLLNPLNSSNRSFVKESISSRTDASLYPQKAFNSTKAFVSTGIDKGNPKLSKEQLETDTPQLIIKTNSASKTTLKLNEFIKTQVKEDVKIEPSPENITKKEDLHEQGALPSSSGCSNTVTIDSSNSIDNYDRRRRLINQLEQSIAKGDEVAAAEAAVKLAKLRLSCSVLSFSSQIVGETTATNHNQHSLATNITSTPDKVLEHNLPSKAEKVEHGDMNTQITKNKSVNKSPENESVLQDKELVEDVKNNELITKPQPSTSEPASSSKFCSADVTINVWIEDKQAARGPIRLNISRQATMADLQRHAEQSLGLATHLQRWIVGRTLCSDDASPVVSLAGPNFKAPFYLCIVQPDKPPVESEVVNDVVETNNNSATDQNVDFYTELMNLEKQSLVPNIEPFECSVCMEQCVSGSGVVLRECIHSFCKECLSDVVQHSQEPVVACPALGCSGFLQEREIRSIVTFEEYERWLARGLATAESGTRNAFHCRTRDCTGWAFCDPGVRRFPCPVCKNTNCVQCQAIHEGETCEQYRTKLRETVTAAETSKDDEGTQALLSSLISRGEALECPECRAIITKKWGCDWVKCSACKTEICWVTKGRRWGPGGRGDTSGGCRCGVDGQRCHPSCGYCH